MYYVDGHLNKAAFGRIVDARNFQRVKGYLDDALHRGAQLALGGRTEAEDLTIHPTILTDVPPEARIMREEIFGPILPITTFGTVEEVCSAVQGGAKPLALYIFSNDPRFIGEVLEGTSSGGVTVNGWAMHWFEPQLPFGGVNESGIGSYHGIHGFRELSHAKSVFAQQ